MRFLEIINKKKFTLISLILFSFVILNLLDGKRGLISYYEKKEIKESLLVEKENLINELKVTQIRNNLLSDNIDLDYLETLYRKKFMVGKVNEKIYIN
jgi:cell division protein DivIC